MSTLYDTDFYAWTQEQAALLDGRHFDAVDWPHVIEEIADLGKSDARAMESELERLVLHLLKWRYQPDGRSGSWRGSIVGARNHLRRLSEDSPSLVPRQPAMLRRVYPDARDVAAEETGLEPQTFPDQCPWDLRTQVLDRTFWPD